MREVPCGGSILLHNPVEQRAGPGRRPRDAQQRPARFPSSPFLPVGQHAYTPSPTSPITTFNLSQPFLSISQSLVPVLHNFNPTPQLFLSLYPAYQRGLPPSCFSMRRKGAYHKRVRGKDHGCRESVCRDQWSVACGNRRTALLFQLVAWDVQPTRVPFEAQLRHLPGEPTRSKILPSASAMTRRKLSHPSTTKSFREFWREWVSRSLSQMSQLQSSLVFLPASRPLFLTPTHLQITNLYH